MPKRRRNRKKRRNFPRQDASKLATSSSARDAEQSGEVQATLLELVSPISTPNAKRSTSSVRIDETKTAAGARNSSMLYETPKNKSKQNEINATNLSLLFDSCVRDEPMLLNNLTPKANLKMQLSLKESFVSNIKRSASVNVLLPQLKSTTCKARSNSSVVILHSPVKQKNPITVDVSTQTAYYNNSLEKQKNNPCVETDLESVHLYDYMNIFETPKISQSDLLDDTDVEALEFSTRNLHDRNLNKISDLNLLSNSQPILKGLNCTNKLTSRSLKRLQNFNEVLLTCDGFSPNIIQNNLKNNLSEGEISFFSPQLFDLESASTPIENVEKNEKLYKNLKKVAYAKHDNILDMNQDCLTPKTPVKDTNDKFNGKIWSHKIEHCQRSSKNHRFYKSVSPKYHKISAVSSRNKWENLKSSRRSKDLERVVPKIFSPVRRKSTERFENILNVSKANAYRQFVARFKKFHTRYSSKWTERIGNICSWLGLTLKKSLSSLCIGRLSVEEVPTKDVSKSADEIGCKCDEYKLQIAALNLKLDALHQQLTCIHSENEEKISNMVLEMGRLRQEQLQFENIVERINFIEEHLKTGTLMLTIPLASPEPIVPPPPPPPPLPPPPGSPIICPLKILSHKINRKPKENTRPVISLDEILKVKLRKTADKPALTRRSTHPVISMEMLGQAKLRPTSRAQTPSSFKSTSSSSSLVSTSPASSLTKILSNVDTNVRRVKRLRKISGYNLDDSRKQFTKRERNGRDDT